MQIQPISVNYSSKSSQQPNFGKAYPVIHWITEEGGKSYAPVATEELSRILQGKLVRMFNKSLVGQKPEKLTLLKSIQRFLFSNDQDYRRHKITRSFYNERGGWANNRFNPISYLITGHDAYNFEQMFGKPIGQARKISPRLISGRANSAELKIKQRDYHEDGLKFVKTRAENAKNNAGERVSLHTKFVIHRNKNGKKDYELVGMKFCPDEGSSNPFVKLGYVKE